MAANTSEANELQADAFISVVNLNKHDTHRTLTFSELSQAIREQCKKDGTVFNSLELHNAFEKYDKNKDGSLGRKEVIALMADMNRQEENNRLILSVFERIDTNNDRLISRSELKEALQLYVKEEMTESELDDFMGQMDKDRDGNVTFDEFVKKIDLFKR